MSDCLSVRPSTYSNTHIATRKLSSHMICNLTFIIIVDKCIQDIKTITKIKRKNYNRINNIFRSIQSYNCNLFNVIL